MPIEISENILKRIPGWISEAVRVHASFSERFFFNFWMSPEQNSRISEEISGEFSNAIFEQNFE